MRLLLTLLAAALVTGAAAAAAAAGPAPYDRDAAARRVETILHRLGDKRIQPANKVFTGVTISPTSSAERYLRIMDEDFARALGVDCTWCHDPADWSRDAHRKFAVTRDMWTMVYHINHDQLRKIEGVDRKARIGCATCHRGEVVPTRALD